MTRPVTAAILTTGVTLDVDPTTGAARGTVHVTLDDAPLTFDTTHRMFRPDCAVVTATRVCGQWTTATAHAVLSGDGHARFVHPHDVPPDWVCDVIAAAVTAISTHHYALKGNPT